MSSWNKADYALSGTPSTITPVVLRTTKKGDLFAEAALFASAYQCDAIAAVASRVRFYPKRSILAAFQNDPALGEQFMAVLANQIHALRAHASKNETSAPPASVSCIISPSLQAPTVERYPSTAP